MRPLGGDEDQITGVCTLFESVESASFPLPDPLTQGNHRSCALPRDALRLGFRSGAGPFRSLARVAVEPRPNQPVALALLRRSDLGIAAPSANRSGRPSPTQASHVYDDLHGRIPLILDGGPCPVGIESTVLDLSRKRPVILRPGTLSAADLAVVLCFEPETFHGKAAQKRSPGTRYRHYSPNLPVYLIHEGVDDQSLYQALEQLATQEAIAYLGARQVPPNIQARHADAASFASQLYGSIQEPRYSGNRTHPPRSIAASNRAGQACRPRGNSTVPIRP